MKTTSKRLEGGPGRVPYSIIETRNKKLLLENPDIDITPYLKRGWVDKVDSNKKTVLKKIFKRSVSL